MLGLNFKLTAPQVDMLLMMTYGKPVLSHGKIFHPMGLDCQTHTISTASALRRKGMLTHNGENYVVTEEGRAVASLIAKKAAEIVRLVDDSVSGETYADMVDAVASLSK